MNPSPHPYSPLDHVLKCTMHICFLNTYIKKKNPKIEYNSPPPSYFLSSWHLLPGRRDQHSSYCKLLSGSCREQHKRKTAYLYFHLYIIVATFGIWLMLLTSHTKIVRCTFDQNIKAIPFSTSPCLCAFMIAPFVSFQKISCTVDFLVDLWTLVLAFAKLKFHLSCSIPCLPR